MSDGPEDAAGDAAEEPPGPNDDERTRRPPGQTRSDRRRRAVRQLLFVIAGSHTGAFLGSSLPTRFGLPGDVSGALLVVVLFGLPFAVDAKWERIEAVAGRLGVDV